MSINLQQPQRGGTSLTVEPTITGNNVTRLLEVINKVDTIPPGMEGLSMRIPSTVTCRVLVDQRGNIRAEQRKGQNSGLFKLFTSVALKWDTRNDTFDFESALEKRTLTEEAIAQLAYDLNYINRLYREIHSQPKPAEDKRILSVLLDEIKGHATKDYYLITNDGYFFNHFEFSLPGDKGFIVAAHPVRSYQDPILKMCHPGSPTQTASYRLCFPCGELDGTPGADVGNIHIFTANRALVKTCLDALRQAFTNGYDPKVDPLTIVKNICTTHETVCAWS